MITIPGVGSGMKALSMLMLFIGVVLLLSENVVIKLNNALAAAWTLYVLYTFLSVFWSPDFEQSFSIAVGLIQVLVLSLVLAKFDLFEEDVRIIESAWILVSIICLLLFFGGAGQQVEDGRVSIVLSSGAVDPNEFCAYFFIPLAIAVNRLFRSPFRWINLLYVIYMMIIFYCIISTGSRGGLLAAAAAVIVSWMFSAPISFKKIALMCIVLGAACFVFTNYFIPNLPEPLLERLNLASVLEDKGSNRALIWDSALNHIFSGTARLIYGYGPYGVTFMRHTMHNQFIQVLMDGGMIGLLLYLNFGVQLLRKAYRNGPVFLGGFAGAFTALMSLTAYAYFKPVWMIFFMCLLTVKGKAIQARDRQSEVEGWLR
jgi:O-antigen ligase